MDANSPKPPEGSPTVGQYSMSTFSTTTCQQPIPLIEYESFKYSLNRKNQYLSSTELQDIPLSVIVVTGRSTRGKSMVLNYLLRYANFRYGFDQGAEEWLQQGDLPCEGWKWKNEDGKMGVRVWSDYFVWQTDKDKKGAILIMSTEGITNANADTNEAHAILALAALCSTVQIHTVQRKIQGNDLNDVELATMSAIMLADLTQSDTQKRGQRLISVVTDWSQEEDVLAPLGYAGGSKYFMEEVSQSPNIKEFYTEIQGFLLPQSQDPDSLKKATIQFKDAINEFADSILSPSKVHLTTNNGKPLRIQEMIKSMYLWIAELNGPELPGVYLDESTSRSLQRIIAKEAAYRAYNRVMIDVFSSKTHFSKDQLEFKNQRAVKYAVAAYDRIPKSDNRYDGELRKELDLMYKTYVHKNQQRKTWYDDAVDAFHQFISDTSYIIWLTLFVVYFILKSYYPESRYVLVLDRNYIAVKRAYVISYLTYLLYSIVG